LPTPTDDYTREPVDWRDPASWDNRFDQSMPVLGSQTVIGLAAANPWLPSPAKASGESLQSSSADLGGVGVGTILKGRFILESLLGRGGMSVVFKARDLMRVEARDSDPHVAIKILNDEFRNHPDSLLALQREARRSQQLAHPDIINVYDFDRDGTSVYMVMELLEGTSLSAVIQKSPAGIPFERAWPILKAAGNAIDYAHQKGVIHADVKPSNIFITSTGATKVIDFSLASALKLAVGERREETVFDPTSLGALTPAYASPERWAGLEATPADDIYGFALVAYELLTGSHPYGRKSAVDALKLGLQPQPIRTLSSRQWRVLMRGLALNRADRFANMREFLVGLQGQPWYRRFWF
jgi:non-specific serine/threonine protein kinase